MNTHLNNTTKFARSTAALTILEMLVSTAILSFMVLGLTAMFVQTQKVFKSGIKRSQVSDTERTVGDLIANDLAQVFDGANPVVTNLMWSWTREQQFTLYEDPAGSGQLKAFRTNQLQTIYMLAHTNANWVGIGYSFSNVTSGFGTLYRFSISMNSPYAPSNMFDYFRYHLNPPVNNPDPFRTNFSPVADGVVHLKLRAFDNYGNQVGKETDFRNGYGDYTLPGISYVSNNYPAAVTNTLPASFDLEVGVLEPEALDHLRSLAGNTVAQSNYFLSLAGKMEIYHTRVAVRGAMIQ